MWNVVAPDESAISEIAAAFATGSSVALHHERRMGFYDMLVNRFMQLADEAAAIFIPAMPGDPGFHWRIAGKRQEQRAIISNMRRCPDPKAGL